MLTCKVCVTPRVRSVFASGRIGLIMWWGPFSSARLHLRVLPS